MKRTIDLPNKEMLLLAAKELRDRAVDTPTPFDSLLTEDEVKANFLYQQKLLSIAAWLDQTANLPEPNFWLDEK